MVVKITNYLFSILALYRTDYNKSFHVRALAKLLNTSHVTLLPYLKNLEKNKILQSQKVGRNKEYRLEFSNILTKEYLMLSEKLETIKYLQKNFLLKKISQHLMDVNLQGTVALFGSYAKNYATETSDIDLFHLGKISENQMTNIKKIGKIYGKELNVKTSSIKNFNQALTTGDPLVKEIIKNHFILQNPDLFVNLLWRNYVAT
ncbi:MAG: nucleotidyltransferase domain-containing protein [Candidatus Bathyarchaeota archaeon]|nr:MAG: nucleotidyltransferase domain-containing protein [Candidatus Bathyarchaeota archaeon]